MSLHSLLAASLSIGLVARAATARDRADQIGGRQGQFKLFALHLGVLATMGTGRAPYDAEAHFRDHPGTAWLGRG